MTICLIILFVLLLLNTTAFFVERARMNRRIKALDSYCFDLNLEICRTNTNANDLSRQHKHLEGVVAGIEITIENLPSCPMDAVGSQPTSGTPCAAPADSPKGKRRTYTEAEKEQAVAYYEQHKSEGISKTQAAQALGIPPSTYKSWFV